MADAVSRAQVRHAGVRMAREDLADFVRACQELLDRFGRAPGDAAEGARHGSPRFHGAADAVGEWNGEPTGP